MDELLDSNCHPLSLRKSLSAFATGVAIVTARVNGRDIGMTINSFTSLSMDPPLVLWSLRKASVLRDDFDRCGHYAIHILATDQLALSRQFSAAGERFHNVAFERGAAGTPLIGNCCAVFECASQHSYDGGDHVIFVGRILRHTSADCAPLVFHGGRYQSLNRALEPA